MKEIQARPSSLVWLFAGTVFLSAFLLFQVQPMIGKYILPWFGSAPATWATALLFFQLMLLGGYAYAHFVVSRLGWRQQAWLHGMLLALALLALPVTPSEALKPIGADAPIARILLILTLSVGAPIFLLAATSPLLQRWFAYLHPAKSPYRLFALSNFGSLLALLSYPFVIERLVSLQVQTWIWSLGFLLFAAMCAACGWRLLRPRDAVRPAAASAEEQLPGGIALQQHRFETVAVSYKLGLTWLALSACGSGLLLAVTNQVSLDIAAVPFLWIIPLSLYLLSFVLCFDSERWYFRPLFSALLPLVLINTLRLLYVGEELGIVDQVLGYALTLFVCCMCCHGELARLRPAPQGLTLFFLIVAIGGALGGMFVALLAPLMFSGYYELHVLLICCYGLLVWLQLPGLFQQEYGSGTGLVIRVLSNVCWATTLLAIIVGSYYAFIPGTWSVYDFDADFIAVFSAWQEAMAQGLVIGVAVLFLLLELWRRRRDEALLPWWSSNRGVARLGVSAVLVLGLLSLSGALVWQVQAAQSRVLAQERNFYGVLALMERGLGAANLRLALNHGRIRHGEQHRLYPSWPTTYFGPDSGIGVAIRMHPARSDPVRQFRIGVVGLGAGTLAAYSNARIDPAAPDERYVVADEGSVADYLRFYELNPLVLQWAQQHFSFLHDAGSRGTDLGVFEGDARIVLDRQLQLGQDQRFDVLAIDAFSSDAIPIHLLTLESIQTYLWHLAEGGILAINVTNRHVDLVPVVARLAVATAMEAIHIQNYARPARFVESTDWLLLTRNRAFLESDAVRVDKVPMPVPGPLWTDDYSSLFETLK